MSEKSLITVARIKELERIEMKMQALEAGGVDNWEFYGNALDEYHKMIDKEDAIDNIIEAVIQILGEHIEEPAGAGCGFGVRQEGITIATDILKKGIDKINNG